MPPITRRQKQVLDAIAAFVERHGYTPSLEEIGRSLKLSSVSTVHKHLTNLEKKGLLSREWNRGRSVSVNPPPAPAGAVEIPLLGTVAAGSPIEAVTNPDTITVPAELIGRRRAFALKVKGDSMIEEHICDGDTVILDARDTARPGETVVALVRGHDVTLKKYYRDGAKIRLQPANAALKPIVVPEDQVRIQGVVIGVLRRY